jgi:hypothetical protein
LPALRQVLEVVGLAFALEVAGALELAVGVDVEVVGLGLALGLALEVALPVPVAVAVAVEVPVAVAVPLLLPVLAGAAVLWLAEAVPELAAWPVLDELAADDEHLAPAAGLLAWPDPVLKGEPPP